MKNAVESLMETDHESLAGLLAELETELARSNLPRAFELLDLFWARLAMHIRAEHLHLFTALANAPASVFTGKGNLPTSEEVRNLLSVLRADHDFFMKELARTIKFMRVIAGSQPARAEDVAEVQQRMMVIKQRLEAHNQLEEERAYIWPVLLFDGPTVARLRASLQHELENLPPRFG